jgi:hypothetical protein
MSHSARSIPPRWFVVAALTIPVVAWTLAADAQFVSGQVQQGGGPKQCCFNNFRYAGTCAVQTGHNESCSRVLSYLNNADSVGQSYCGNTTVRGGWTIVDCSAGTSSFEIESDHDLISPQNPTQAPRAVSPQSTGVQHKRDVGTSGQNFVTPVSPSDVTVSEPGVINL